MVLVLPLNSLVSIVLQPTCLCVESAESPTEISVLYSVWETNLRISVNVSLSSFKGKPKSLKFKHFWLVFLKNKDKEETKKH